MIEHINANHIHEQKYLCGRCNYTGIHLRDLQRHQNTMHDIPFKCDKCDSEFTTKQSLQKHLKDAHKPTRTFYRKTNLTKATNPLTVPNVSKSNVKLIRTPSPQPLSHVQQDLHETGK